MERIFTISNLTELDTNTGKCGYVTDITSEYVTTYIMSPFPDMVVTARNPSVGTTFAIVLMDACSIHSFVGAVLLMTRAVAKT